MSKLLSQVLYPRKFTYTADERLRTIEAHVCVVYPASPIYLTLYFYEINGGEMSFLKMVTRVTEVDGGVRL